MHIDRIYERYVSETPTHVVVQNKSSTITLERCRMYNSHLDIHGFLYTDYADKEYKQKGAAETTHSAAAKRGWEKRRGKRIKAE